MGFIDFLFPKYCVNCKKLGDYICTNCFAYISFDTETICLICNRASVDGKTHPGCKTRYTIDGALAAIAYKGIAKKLLYNFKYKPYLSDLQTVLTDLFYESLIQNEQFHKVYTQSPILIPIPLHKSKLKQRGYNHAKILSTELAKRLKLPTIDELIRVKKTSSQFGLDRKKRQENLAGAFAPAPNILMPQYPNVLLVDDIVTTGSTLLEAANTLKRNGAKTVWGLALAKG